jgi:hypothetical protein
MRWGNWLRERRKLGARRRLRPPERERAVGALGVHPVEEQHVEVQSQRVGRTDEGRPELPQCVSIAGW